MEIGAPREAIVALCCNLQACERHIRAIFQDGLKSCVFRASSVRWEMRSVHLTLLLLVLLLVPVDAQSEVDILSQWREAITEDEEEATLLNDVNPVDFNSLDYFGTWNYWNSADYFATWNKSDPNACGWVGVTCTAQFTVEELDLSGWALSSWGPLGILAGLRDLHHLDLSYSNLVPINFSASDPSSNYTISAFTNLFPQDVGLLSGLTYLDLSSSELQGTISANISNCTRLRYLSLEQNQLSGEIPSLHGLANLSILLLGGNSFTGAFPNSLSGIGSVLRIVDLSDNELGGAIPSLSSFPNLVELKLDNNNFTEFTDPQSSSANGLQRLIVSGNQLGGVIPTYITNLRNLKLLNMSRNRLSGIPSGFSRLWNSNLRAVDLSQNNLSGNIPADFLVPLPNSTVYINLSHNLLSGNLKLNDTLFQLYSIVDLSYNQFSEPLPLILSGNDQGIGSLWLGNNQFSGDIVDVLIQATSQAFYLSTKQLSLFNNRLTGDLSRMVGKWANLSLQVIDVSNNYLQMSTTTAVPDPLGATLQNFADNFKTFYGTFYGINPLGIQLHLAGNNFSGTSLPTKCFGQSSSGNYFEVLDLSNNSLKGEILGDVFNATCLQQLKFLNLSNNQLTGPVPESIVMLPNLMVLDVSSNSLSGPLPYIQTSSPFYNPTIFANNPGLCGGPLPPCPSNNSHPTGVPWWVVLVITLVSTMSVVATCLVSTWRWRVYQQRHQQDADLIKTLMERESASLMPLRELKRATDNFAGSARVGEGGFGTVYIGKLGDGTTVAIKRSKREGSEADKEQFLNEVRILSQVNHRFLVKLLGCCMENKIALLVFEFVSNGTLHDHLHGKTGAAHLSWKQRLNIGVQTADALSYLHSATSFPIYHRDVKSANILLDDDFNAKVADFGISKLAPVRATHISTVAVQGTMGYIDPEYYTSFQLTDKSDVYSFGVVLLELISAKPAIDFRRGGDETSLINFARPHMERGDLETFIDPALMETYLDPAYRGRDSILNVGRLAMKCLDMRSKCRPSMNEIRRELENLGLEFNGASENSDSIDEYHSEAPEHDHKRPLSESKRPLSESFYGESASFSIQNDTNSIEMSQCPL